MKEQRFLSFRIGMAGLILVVFAACWATPSEKEVVKMKHAMIAGKDYDPASGADNYRSAGDNARSRYYCNPDFFLLEPNDTLAIISRFQTMQQTTEWSCGNVAALMVLNYYNKKDLTEWELAVAMSSMADDDIPGALPGTADEYPEYGTNVKELHDFFARLQGFKIVESSYKAAYGKNDLVKNGDGYPPCDSGNLYPKFAAPGEFASWLLSHLKSKRPVMAEWSDWDGHWVVIIGYDNNGTPSFVGDDILIFADPYDTSDHWQDGYSIASLERFFYMWKDRAVAPKPYQLQPFLIVECNR